MTGPGATGSRHQRPWAAPTSPRAGRSKRGPPDHGPSAGRGRRRRPGTAGSPSYAVPTRLASRGGGIPPPAAPCGTTNRTLMLRHAICHLGPPRQHSTLNTQTAPAPGAPRSSFAAKATKARLVWVCACVLAVRRSTTNRKSGAPLLHERRCALAAAAAVSASRRAARLPPRAASAGSCWSRPGDKAALQTRGPCRRRRGVLRPGVARPGALPRAAPPGP